MSDEGEIDVESDNVAEGGDMNEDFSGKVRFYVLDVDLSPKFIVSIPWNVMFYYTTRCGNVLINFYFKEEFKF